MKLLQSQVRLMDVEVAKHRAFDPMFGLSMRYLGKEHKHPIEARNAERELLEYINGVVGAYAKYPDENVGDREAFIDDAIREAHAAIPLSCSYLIPPGIFWRVAKTVRCRWTEGAEQTFLGNGTAHQNQGSGPIRPESSATPEGGPRGSCVAKNLDHLRLEGKLSYRQLARLIGPGDGDNKAVSKHCKGKRIPEDHTIAEYAAAFSKHLGRTITAEQIRSFDFAKSQ